MIDFKSKIKSAFDSNGFVYNGLAWAYGFISRKPVVRRSAYMRFWKDSRFDKDELWMASSLPRNVFDHVVDSLQPKSVLDVGCGIGLTLQYAIEKNLDGFGLEGSKAALKVSPVRSQIQFANLNKPQFLGKKYDLVWCVEVAEHIHPKFTDIFLDTLVNHGDSILLSAAPPGQGGAGHFNEQPQSYWVQLLHDRHFDLHERLTKSIQSLDDAFAENMMLFTRRKK